jgi:hypothetical protein
MDELQPLLKEAPDGVSEYSFANLYLFRRHYSYRVALAAAHNGGRTLVIAGKHGGQSFFCTPLGLPSRDALEALFRSYHYWKGIPASIVEAAPQPLLENWGLTLGEDRDNFDYLYRREDLAELPGKRYHKKRNLVSAFSGLYSAEELPLGPQTREAALTVLEGWRAQRGDEGDYDACREALELLETLPQLLGTLYLVDGAPAAFCLGEALVGGTMFAIHFEKALEDYKGIYQFINQRFAAGLPPQYSIINREQDLGDSGLRQAKMTYRPLGFVKKYRAHPPMGGFNGRCVIG